MKDVLRKKLTLTGWMHNNKALVAVSILLAVVLWVAVMTDNTTTRQRSISVPVTVSLSNSYADQAGLRLLEEVKENVTVVVQGTWSAIAQLTTDDIQVHADVSTVQKSGKQMVTLVPSRNSSAADYEIVSCSPSQVEIECDYWETLTVPLEIDTSSVKVADEKTMQLGAPVPDVGKEGTLSVSGPQTIVRSIAKIVATPESEEPLVETRNFSPELAAVTEKGTKVELKNCEIKGLEGKTLTLTVPVDFYKDLKIDLDWHNAPASIRDKAELLTVEPKTIKVAGPKDALTAMGDTLTLNTIDFDHLVGKKYEWKFPVTLPDAVTNVNDVKEVKVTLDLSGYEKKIVPLTVSDANVKFQNNSANKKTAVEKKTVNLTLFGEADSLKNVTADNLKVTVNLTGAKEAGLMNYTGTVSAEDTKNMWFFYGNSAAGIPVYVNLS